MREEGVRGSEAKREKGGGEGGGEVDRKLMIRTPRPPLLPIPPVPKSCTALFAFLSSSPHLTNPSSCYIQALDCLPAGLCTHISAS